MDLLQPSSPVLLFDGDCAFCNGWVRFIIEREKAPALKFGTLSSPMAQKLLEARKIQPLDTPDSLILLEGERVFWWSSAALRVARYLRWPWRLALLFLLVPRPLRDAIYRWVARNRYRWFGRASTCIALTPHLQSRFLE
ncbi:MAG: DCC1-like thiol-disulfide oxidoreductase family protein [Sandaracinaceae bacterium]|nr:DCC1-like thiol-disulfide oxidoreductase family protein [Sandaracinaceae bacterium]